MTPSFSIIIPTVGRPSLQRTLDSIESGPQDEVIVVADGHEAACLVANAWSPTIGRSYYETEETHSFGNWQRQYGMTKATGDLLLFMDDDDVYLPGALDLVRRVVRAYPDTIVLCRYYDHLGGVFWHDPVVRPGKGGIGGLVVFATCSRGGWARLRDARRSHDASRRDGVCQLH